VPIGEVAPVSGATLSDAPAESPVTSSTGKGEAATLRLSENLSIPRQPGRAREEIPQAALPVAAALPAINARLPVQEAAPASTNASTGIEKRALEPNPREQAERLYRSALSQLAQGREQDGMATLNAALRSDPEHAAARQLLIKLNIDRRAYEAAGADLEEGLRRLPQQTGWAMLLSRIKLDRGDPEGALAVLERHENHAGSAADYQAAIAAVLQRLNRLSESAARYLRAAQSEPTNGRWWLGLGMVSEASGKTVEARNAYRNAVETGSLSPDLRAYAESRAK
jgi:MSHA biogenesis protein MshN